MHLLYCDESNLETRKGDFFLYGGLAIPADSTKDISAEMDALRQRNKVDRLFPLKFAPGPPGMSHADFIELKKATVAIAIRFQCKFFVSILLHDIAKSPEEARRKEINRVAYHFDCYLNRVGGPGLVLIDRFSDQEIDKHLREKFSVGITGLPFSSELRLSNVVGFHYSAIGQSHFPSLIDIVLGSMRFAINAITRDDAKLIPTAKAILELIAPLFHQDIPPSVAEISLCFSPKTVKVPTYLSRYQKLKEFFGECGILAAQKITDEPMY